MRTWCKSYQRSHTPRQFKMKFIFNFHRTSDICTSTDMWLTPINVECTNWISRIWDTFAARTWRPTTACQLAFNFQLCVSPLHTPRHFSFVPSHLLLLFQLSGHVHACTQLHVHDNNKRHPLFLRCAFFECFVRKLNFLNIENSLQCFCVTINLHFDVFFS